MNWYKQARQPYLSDGGHRVYDPDELDTEFDLYIDGEKRTYYGLNRREVEIIRWMIKQPHIPSGRIINKLKPNSRKDLHQDPEPTPPPVPEPPKKPQQGQFSFMD